MNRGHAAGGDEVAENDLRIGAGGLRVGQLPNCVSRRGVKLVLANDLDAEEVDLGPRHGLREQEEPFAHADFDLDGVRVDEELRPIEWANRTHVR